MFVEEAGGGRVSTSQCRWPHLHDNQPNICSDPDHALRLHDFANICGLGGERKRSRSRVYQDGGAVELIVENTVIRGTGRAKASCQVTRQSRAAARQLGMPLSNGRGDNQVAAMIGGCEYRDPVAACFKQFAHWPRARTSFGEQA